MKRRGKNGHNTKQQKRKGWAQRNSNVGKRERERGKKKAGGGAEWPDNFPVRTKSWTYSVLFCTWQAQLSNAAQKTRTLEKKKKKWIKPEALKCGDGLDQNKPSIGAIFLSKSQPPVPLYLLERVPYLVLN